MAFNDRVAKKTLAHAAGGSVAAFPTVKNVIYGKWPCTSIKLIAHSMRRNDALPAVCIRYCFGQPVADPRNIKTEPKKIQRLIDLKFPIKVLRRHAQQCGHEIPLYAKIPTDADDAKGKPSS